MSNSFVLFFCAILILPADSVLCQIFAPAVNYAVGLRPYTIVTADFDKDGDFDLAAALSGAFNSDEIGWVRILKNNGKGTFTVSDSIAVGDAPCLEAADLDNDGFVDLLVSDIYTKRVYILLNDRTGKFVVVDTFASGRGSYTNSFEPCAADLDGDGDLDLAVPVWPDSVSIFVNDGHAKFSGPTSYQTGFHPYKAISADIDRDGDLDLVVTNNGAGTVSVFLNNGHGTFASRVDYPVGIFPQGPSLADFNGDGILDLAVANASPNTPYVSVFMGRGDGTFGPRVDYAGCRPHSIASADYNRDGSIDMAVANNECSSVSIFLNIGNGTFAIPFSLAAGPGTNHVVAEDFDGDGDLDLAAENFDLDGTAGNTVSVFINQVVTLVTDAEVLPKMYSLEQNYPNPFNPSTTIRFSLPRTDFVNLRIFNLLGEQISTLVSERLSAGTHQAEWDAPYLASGVYFYRLQAGAFIQTKKLILLK